MPGNGHNIPRRAFLVRAGAAMATSALAAPALARNAAPVQALSGSAFATEWQISLPGNSVPVGLMTDIKALLAKIDLQMSPYRSDSDISRLNTAGAGLCAAPSEMVLVADAALDLAAKSGGAFDPTVGPLVARWGFGPIEGDMAPGWSGLAVEAGGIVKDHDSLTLDLCGIAKGYALDGMADLVAAAGYSDFLIDLGGEVVARGQHPSGRAWHVGIEDPRPDSTGLWDVLALSDLAVATSGDRENGYTLDGRRYSHIIDPATREPVEATIASVSVLGPDAMHADGWATALMAAGSTAGPELARAHNLSALFLLRDGNGGLTRVSTGTFDAARA